MAKHLHAGQPCEHPTKKTCEEARREAMGRCVELTQADKSGSTSCTNWAVERVNDRPVCGVHYQSMLERERKANNQAAKKARLNGAIERFMAWTVLHPSVWERMPPG